MTEELDFAGHLQKAEDLYVGALEANDFTKSIHVILTKDKQYALVRREHLEKLVGRKFVETIR